MRGVMEKAIAVRVGFLRDCRRHGIVSPVYVLSDLNRANLGTKPLGRLDMQRERAMMQVMPKRTDAPEAVAPTRFPQLDFSKGGKPSPVC